MDINLDQLDALDQENETPAKKPGRRNPLEKFAGDNDPVEKKKMYKRRNDSFSLQENVLNAFKQHCNEEGKNKSRIVESLVIEYLTKNNVKY